MADYPLNANHPSRIGQAQQKAQGQQNRMAMGRPDGGMGFPTNQNPSFAGNLMDPSRIYGRHEGDQNFGQSPVGSGAMGVAGSDVMTGGGAAGSMRAGQAGQQRGQGLMGTMPQLAAMQPYQKGSQPNTRGMFAQLDNQVSGMAQREQAKNAGGGKDTLLAGYAQKPAGIAATGAAPKVAAPQLPAMAKIGAPPMGPTQDEMGSRSSRPGYPSVASSGGQMDPRLVGSKQQVQRAQGRIDGANIAKQGGIVGPPAPQLAQAGPPAANPMAQALNGGQTQQQSMAVQLMAQYQAANARGQAIEAKWGAGHPEAAQHYAQGGQLLNAATAAMGHEGQQANSTKELALKERELGQNDERIKAGITARTDPRVAAQSFLEATGNFPGYEKMLADIGASESAKKLPPGQAAPPNLAQAVATGQHTWLSSMLKGENTDPAAILSAMKGYKIDPGSPEGQNIRESVTQHLGPEGTKSWADMGDPMKGGFSFLGGLLSGQSSHDAADWLRGQPRPVQQAQGWIPQWMNRPKVATVARPSVPPVKSGVGPQAANPMASGFRN